MSDDDKVVPIKKTLAEEIREKITDVAAKATSTDHAAVADLIKRATGASYSVEMITLTPVMCALLFLNHNSHNRPWHAHWTEELARRMTIGQWKRNSMSVGFYADGKIEDMQHRCGAAAIAGMTLVVACVFGIEKDSVDTIDGGKRRSGADHAGLDGITDATRKQAIVKSAAAYLVKAGDKNAALKSEMEVKKAIEENDQMLALAMQIAEQSKEGIAGGGVLKPTAADAFAYVCLKGGWAAQRTREWLALFQRGVSNLGDNDPQFVAANLIETRRKRTSRTEKLNTSKEIGIAMFAMLEMHKGVKSVSPKHVKAAVDGKTLPDPHYPGDAAAQAAAA